MRILYNKGLDILGHSHALNKEDAIATSVWNNLKRRAEDCSEQPPSKLVRTKLRGLSDGVL